MNHSTTAHKTREQLHHFLGGLSPHFSKPTATFVGDMLYGIQTALDAPITMKKQEGRLAGHLARLGAKRIGRDTLIVMVPSDIRKLYAGKTYELQYGVMSVALPQRPDEP